MSVNIVLPTLSAWAASRLTHILESKTQKDFDATFEVTFAANCDFTVNGKPVSRDEYKSQLLEQSAADPKESGTRVNIEGQTEIEVGNQGQLVRTLYSTTSYHIAEVRFRWTGWLGRNFLHGTLRLQIPRSRCPFGKQGVFFSQSVVSSLFSCPMKADLDRSCSIEPTEKNPQNPKLPIRGYFDPRRVTTVNQVVAETNYQVTIPHSSVAKATTAEKSSSKIELGPEPIRLPPNFIPKHQGSFGGRFEPGPVIPPFGGHFGPGPVHLPPSETGATPETLPGFGAFGVGPVIVPGETLGELKSSNDH